MSHMIYKLKMVKVNDLGILCTLSMLGAHKASDQVTIKKSPNLKGQLVGRPWWDRQIRDRTVCGCHSQNMEGRRQRKVSRIPSSRWTWLQETIWLTKLIPQCSSNKTVSHHLRSTKQNQLAVPKCRCRISSSHNSKFQISSIVHFLRGIMHWTISNRKCST